MKSWENKTSKYQYVSTKTVVFFPHEKHFSPWQQLQYKHPWTRWGCNWSADLTCELGQSSFGRTRVQDSLVDKWNYSKEKKKAGQPEDATNKANFGKKEKENNFFSFDPNHLFSVFKIFLFLAREKKTSSVGKK